VNTPAKGLLSDTVPVSAKSRREARYLAGCLLVPVVLLLVVIIAALVDIFFTHKFLGDIPEPGDDSDLLVTWDTPAAGANGYTYYDEAVNACTLTYKESELVETLICEIWDERTADRLLAQNQQAVTALQQAMEADQFVVPDPGYPEVVQNRTLGVSWAPEGAAFAWDYWDFRFRILPLYLITIKRAQADEDLARAVESLAHLITLCGQIHRSKGSTVECLMTSLGRELLAATEQVTLDEQITADQLETLADAVEALPTLVESGTMRLRVQFTLNARKLAAVNSFFGPNKLRTRIAECVRQRLEWLDTPNTDFPEFERATWAEITILSSAIGWDSPWPYRSYGANRRILQAFLAARRYELDHGALPDTLEALVPDYLDAVPIDPYTGEPLVYDQTTGAIQTADKNYTIHLRE